MLHNQRLPSEIITSTLTVTTDHPYVWGSDKSNELFLLVHFLVFWATSRPWHVVTPSPPTLSAKAFCFRAVHLPRSSARSFVRTDLVATMSHERLEHSWWNLHSLAPTDDLVRFRRSQVKVTTGHRGGESINVHFSILYLNYISHRNVAWQLFTFSKE